MLPNFIKQHKHECTRTNTGIQIVLVYLIVYLNVLVKANTNNQ